MTTLSNQKSGIDSDDLLILSLFIRFFSDETVQKKIDFLVSSEDAEKDKDATGWENWLKFEFRFFPS